VNARKAALRSSATWLADLDLGPDAAVADLWAPSARWVAPDAEDRARVRAVVAAVDREVALEEADWQERRHLAELRDRQERAPAEEAWRDACEVLEARRARVSSWVGGVFALALPLVALLWLLAR
jgi:hypothetical protein